VEPEAIDLGLSVKWANFNVGAFHPTHCGDYFAWGEIDTKDKYGWSNYKWCEGTEATITKYNRADGLITLLPEDDAAYVHWGEKWRMPTRDEMESLNNCEWTLITKNGVKGYIVAGRNSHASKSIFLPAAGIVYHDGVSNVGLHGYYWSKSLFRGSPGGAHVMEIDSNYIDRYPHSRELGLSVRAVCP
jgi:hypothetical protein